MSLKFATEQQQRCLIVSCMDVHYGYMVRNPFVLRYLTITHVEWKSR